MLAQRNDWILLSGDGALRALAEKERVICHGVLWILDQFAHQRGVALKHLREGLQKLADHPRCRLPRNEIQLRIERYDTLLATD